MSSQVHKSSLNYIAVLPYYNCASYLGRALQSLIRQAPPPLKIIIVDNASTDKSSLNLKAQDLLSVPVEVLCLAQNFGPFVAKNLAVHYILERTSCDYILFLDADDFFLDNALYSMSKELAQNQNALAVYPHCLRVSSGNVQLFTPHPRTGLRTRKCFAGMLAHRDLFKKVGFFDSVRFGGDGEFHRRCLNMLGSQVFCEVSAPLYFAEDRENSLTKLKGQETGHDAALSSIRQRYALSFTNSKTYTPLLSIKKLLPKEMCVFSNIVLSSSVAKSKILGDSPPFELLAPLNLCVSKSCDSLNELLAQTLMPQEMKDWFSWTML